MILLVPIGPVPIYLISWLEDKLNSFESLEAKVGKAVPLPRTGYDKERQQFAAEAVSQTLQALQCPEADRLVGLLDQDCYSPGLNFIFGHAAVNGREAFVVLPRLRQNFYGLDEDKNLFKERILKEAAHELGHTWGLAHCDQPGCVMRFSDSLQDTDEKAAEFCHLCREKLPH